MNKRKLGRERMGLGSKFVYAEPQPVLYQIIRTRIASWCFQFLWDIHQIIVKSLDFELNHTRLCCINMPLTRYRDQAGILANAALIWDSMHGIPYLRRRRGDQSMNEVTIHHLNQDAPTRNILPVISKGSFTPEIYYAIAIAITISMGCASISAIMIAITIHPIEKNRNRNHIRNRNRVINRRRV